ncbi:MAG: glycosyltransferase, partial [Actinomycetales bacterium]
LIDDGALQVADVFDAKLPPTDELARVSVEHCRAGVEGATVGRLVLMDGDQPLKRWWLVAPRQLRSLAQPPRVVFMLTRYPARLKVTDLTGWRLRGPKATLAVLARFRRSLHRVVGFAGREETSRGWIVRRVRDPHYSSAHSRDRVRHRDELGLPQDKVLVGIFGTVGERKNGPLILDAIKQSGLDALLVLAGGVEEEVHAWIAGLDASDRALLFVRDEFLDNDVLDQFVAAADVVPLALTNNGPSGIMGKAQAAGVPVVTTGSVVRAREVEATGTGVACDFTAESIAAALRTAVEGDFTGSALDHVTPEEFGRTLLGVDEQGRPYERNR